MGPSPDRYLLLRLAQPTELHGQRGLNRRTYYLRGLHLSLDGERAHQGLSNQYRRPRSLAHLNRHRCWT